MLTPIHNHFNLRRLCQVDLAPDVVARLDRPSELKDPKKFEDHVVTVPTPHGDLVLFRVGVRGVSHVVTPTPEVALALAPPD